MSNRQDEGESMVRPKLLEKVVTANVGLSIFAESLEAQNASVIAVNWQPPAEGDPEILDLLDRLL